MHQNPVFNADKLRKYQESPTEFGDRVPPRPPPELVEGREEFEVERILDDKRFGRTHKWLVLWKGYLSENATCETKDSVKNAGELLAEYEASKRKGQ